MPRNRASSLGALREGGYKPVSVKDEIRKNLVRKMAENSPLFPGIVGYEKTVIPGLANALLAKHDFILLGLRGQAKTRILRSLVEFLEPEIPVLEGSPINDDPMQPTSSWGKRRVEEAGDEAPVGWLTREERYNEKLATPDVSIADLLGDIDPIKAATRKLTFSDPEVIHFGVIPRTNRGIFAINELPDLAPRIQVGLLNLLEERDLQIRGFPIRIPLDLLMVFSANPEDYTNRGNIITPLKDRISSQILTHYPADIASAIEITRQEAWTDREAFADRVPPLFRRIIEEITFAARESDLVDPASGVSARLSIAALELLTSNLERRAISTGEDRPYPRVCDLPMVLPAITGKLEMVYEGEQAGIEIVVRQLMGVALRKVFAEKFPVIDKPAGSGGQDDNGPYAKILAWFAAGHEIEISDELSSADYQSALEKVPTLLDLAASASETAAEKYFLAELVLESLALHLKLTRKDLDSSVTYQEMVRLQLLRPHSRGRGQDDVLPS